MQQHPANRAAPGLRERKKRESRDAMHRAALELVAEHGLAAVTVDHIAERAGVSPRTLFNYWGSKEGVVLGIEPGDHSELLEFVRMRPEGEDPAVTMRLMLRIHLEHATPDRSIRTLKRTVLRREPHLAHVFINATNDVQRTLIDILAERLSRHHDAELAFDLAAMHVFWAFGISRAAHAISMHRDIDLLEALEWALAHLEHGRIHL